MGARVIRKIQPKTRVKWHEVRAFAAIMAAVGLPLVLAYVLAAMDMRTDLSDLKASRPVAADGAAMVGWAELESARWRLADRDRMIGYMMDQIEPTAENSPVKTFVLMPEAGHFLHPAHRDPDAMVEVRLRRPAAFRFRQLVWVTGLLTRGMETAPDRASYLMWDADFMVAREPDIIRWFVP